MVPRTIASPDDLYAAMPANSTLYPGFCLLELPFRRFPLDGSVLAYVYVSHARGGIECENLVDDFDRVAELHGLQRIEGCVCLHIGEMYQPGGSDT